MLVAVMGGLNTIGHGAAEAMGHPGGLRAEERRFAGATEVGPALLDLTLDLWQCDPRKQGPALSEPTESTDGSQLVKNNNKGQRKT